MRISFKQMLFFYIILSLLLSLVLFKSLVYSKSIAVTDGAPGKAAGSGLRGPAGPAR